MNTSTPIAEVNRAQAQAWDGDEGSYWAEHADHFDRSVALYHGELLDAAAIDDADAILDVGCGTGQTTRDAARRAPRGSALGVDLSTRMLDVARGRAIDEGVANVSFLQADAQAHQFERDHFDVVISRTGCMFFGEPVEAFRNIARGIRPGGRCALLTWQGADANEWIPTFATALAAGREPRVPPAGVPGPFALSDADRVHAVLADAGLVDVELEGRRAGMWFGHDAKDAHRFVLGLLGWMLGDADEATRARAIDDLRAVMAAHATADGVVFGSAAWIITARRPSDDR